MTGLLVDEEIETAIKPLWRETKPSIAAQGIRAALSTEAASQLDQCPDYVWDLVDIAAQRGIELGKTMK